ncbi:MAG: tail fiber domain-containing protein [Pyrinomonadaceae bacterium]
MILKARFLFMALVCVVLFVGATSAQTTAFTYQGSLNDGANPANGNYDLEFRLFDAVSGGAQQGATVTVNSVAVANGMFSVSLDFGSQFPGTGRFLEIGVRTTGGGAFTLLAPRQPVNSSPYSIKSLNSDTATSATQLGGLTANGFIQNTTIQQSATNFNINGTGTANILGVTTQFNIGGDRILSNSGTGNLFVGVNAGSANTGVSNSFFGRDAGQANTSGGGNSFFGRNAGSSNTTGVANSFVGSSAGFSNTTGNENSFFGNNAGAFTTANNNAFFGASAGFGNTTGQSNSFFGTSAGFSNSTGTSNAFFGTNAGSSNFTGSQNTIVGSGADVAANNLTNATAIGAGAVVGTSNTVVLGRQADAVSVPGTLNVVGTATANILNATIQFNISGSRVLSNAGTNNLFAGVNAGPVNTGNDNSFFGSDAGQSNTSGFANAFFGRKAGSSSSIGSTNSFFGYHAGQSNSTGFGNSFFGANSGDANTMGISNAFFGSSAGRLSTADDNSFIGANAGFSTTSGGKNTFLGSSAGNFNSIGSGNTIVGNNADVASNNLTNATAIGNLALVSASNSLVLGSISGVNSSIVDTNVGIGTTTPQSRLHVDGAILVTGPRTATPVGNAMTLSSDATADAIQTFNNRPLAINPSGNNVGIGTNAPLDKLHVSGIIRVATLGAAGGSTLCRNSDNQIANCSSSLRYKTNIDRFGFGLGIINQLKPITFDWKAGGMHDLGLAAEDVAAIEPLLVTYNDKGEVEGVKYDRIGIVLVNAVKEQQAQIKEQQKQIEELRALVCELKPEAKVCIGP